MSKRGTSFVLRSALTLVFLASLFINTPPAMASGSIIYVNSAATGHNNGKSWADAYKSLQLALSHATAGKKIWVAKGTYKPSLAASLSDPRTKTFTLINGVAIYGGFAGTETKLSQRNYKTNVTTLSGDIGIKGNAADNAYHVVVGSNTDSTAVLDGFTIKSGRADGPADNYKGGGGIQIFTGSPTLRNLVISGNMALTWGGGLEAIASSNPSLTNVRFSKNTGVAGGGMYLQGSAATLSKCVFTGNKAPAGTGGGLHNFGSSPIISKSVFTGNTADFYGGGMYDGNGSSPQVTDSTFSGNSAFHGGAIYNEMSNNDPQLRNVTIDHNIASHLGGGIYSSHSNPSLINVTLYANQAADGGAMYNEAGIPAMNGVTMTGNTATGTGAGMYDVDGTTPVISNSILFDSATNEVFSASPSAGALLSTLIEASSCPTGMGCDPNVIFALGFDPIIDPHLGPLQNNGGFTKTAALGADSWALDYGNPATCEASDQRGVSRSQGYACDLGAYEAHAQIFTSQASADGWVLESAKLSNKGGSMSSTDPALYVGDDASDRRYRSLVSFNTAALPDSAALISVRLGVVQQSSQGNPFTTQGLLVADLAKPYFGTGSGLARADWQAAATVSQAGVIATLLRPDNSLYEGLLSGPARAKVNKTGLTQFRLRFTSDTYDAAAQWLALYSGSTATVANRPTLIVYYNP